MVETVGIGQADSKITDLVDLSIYVMTNDYGSSGQLEKIGMIDYADIIVLNKFDKQGAEDALAEVKKQWRRSHHQFDINDNEIPVIPTIASQLNDEGILNLHTTLAEQLSKQKSRFIEDFGYRPIPRGHFVPKLIPKDRVQYLFRNLQTSSN